MQFALGLIAAVLCAGASFAQAPATSPSSQTPLRLIVPFTPGTGIDLIARTVGPRLSERLGRPVVVDNRAGASGNIGTEAVVRAQPGSTLLVSVNTLVMNAGLYPKLPFDPVKDLVPVSLTSWGQLILVASPQTGFRTAADLIAAAKKSPGRINYASPGVGTPHHLSMELFKSTAGVFLTHIPYRGTAPAVTDLLGGQVDVAFLPIHVALQHVKAGKLNALGIGSDKRHALLPDLPTLAEAKAGNVNVDMWYGVFAPPGTSAAEVTRLNRELKDILATEDVKRAFQTQGMDPASSSPEEFKALVQKDAVRWARLVKAQNITAE
ncbi:MAG: tripartite tricarboxylate transporter substrate binding protein [Comamonadaceae bacterium]|nr:MAG: tripartite tricarboxylate transporter substrate binding protein [Comamonadaceae bacterium]